MNNKVIGVFFLLFALLSIQCDRAVWSRTAEFVVKNETEKTFYVHIQPTDLFAYYKDTLSGYIAPFEIFKGEFYRDKITQQMIKGVFTTELCLYNISDTTTIREKIFGGNNSSEDQYKFVAPYSSYESKYSIEKTFYVETTTLRITDSLVQIMFKDYTMLEKFKDYYFQSH